MGLSGGVGGPASTSVGDFVLGGGPGGNSISVASGLGSAGVGGNAARGGGGAAAVSGTLAGGAGQAPGGGGGGSNQNPSGAALVGGAGATGMIVVTEFYSGPKTPGVTITTGPFASGPPSSPADGDLWEATSVGGANSGICWQFRYNAASTSPYKWEFIGGPPAFVAVETNEATASGTYAALTTAGPSFTCSRGGDYIVEVAADIFNNTANCGGAMSFDIGATGALDNNALFHVGGPVNLNLNFGGKPTLVPSVAAATALVSKYRTTSGGTANFLYRRMRVTPVRVA